MKQIRVERRKLVAEFFVNTGVAWFAAGVIGIFVNKNFNVIESVIQFIWGFGFSILSLFVATAIIKK